MNTKNGQPPQPIDERAAAIAGDRRHGAAELARECLSLLGDAAMTIPAVDTGALKGALERLAADLAASRPSMTSVQTLLAAWRTRLDVVPRDSVERFRSTARAVAHSLRDESQHASDAAAVRAAGQLASCSTLVSYSYSSTVAAALVALPATIQLVISESRPLFEGHRLAATLSSHGRKATLVTDAQLGEHVKRADAVLVGADSVLPDGALVNKAGTLLLASTARCFDVPFHVCCDTFKLRDATMPPLTIEAMSPQELNAPGWPGIEILNRYFDITPAQFITNLITESGVRRFPGYRAHARGRVNRRPD